LSLGPEVFDINRCLKSRRIDRRADRHSRLVRLSGLARLTRLSRLSRFTGLARLAMARRRVVRRVRRLLAGALVLGGHIGVLDLLRRSSCKPKRGRENGGGELHGKIIIS
jgi:hypothetical protein